MDCNWKTIKAFGMSVVINIYNIIKKTSPDTFWGLTTFEEVTTFGRSLFSGFS